MPIFQVYDISTQILQESSTLLPFLKIFLEDMGSNPLPVISNQVEPL